MIRVKASIGAIIVVFLTFTGTVGHALQILETEEKEDRAFSLTPETQYDIRSMMSQWSVLNDLKEALAKGSYDLVLNEIAGMPEEEKSGPEILSIKIAALIGKRDFTEAEKEVSRLVKRSRVPERFLAMIARMYLRMNRPFEAMKICQTGLMENIRSPAILFEMGRCYDALGKTKTALIYYEKADRLDDAGKVINRRTLKETIAIAYLKLNEFEKAKDVFIDQASQGTVSVIHLIALAKYHASQGELERSINTIDKAIKGTNFQAPIITKAHFLVLAGESQKAINLLKEMKQNYSGSYPKESIELTMSLAYLVMNDTKNALASLERIERSGKGIPNIEVTRSIIFLAMGKKQLVTQELSRASIPFSEMATHQALQNHLEPPSLGPTLGLVYFCLDQGYYTQAIKISQKSLAKTPDNIFLHLTLAQSYQRLGKNTKALSEYRRISEIMPESFALRFQLARACDKAGLHQEALRYYTNLSKERPDFVVAQLAHGGLLERLGQWDRAKDVYESGLNFQPNSVRLLTSLGWTYSHTKDFDSLTGLLRTLKANNKAKPASIWHLEGWCAYQRKDFLKATELLTKALEANPGNPEICYHLGMALRSSGEHLKADNLLEQTLLFPEQREKYEKTIEKISPQKARNH
ncbi:MAG: tetratricopeptide repeat protein [Desulfobacteraceae bacterium]|nr:tetratricopeptide repeat protein [Desulfobacteraceae bacterium]